MGVAFSAAQEPCGARFSVPGPCRPVTSIGNRPVAHALMRAVPALMLALVAAPPSVHTSVDAARTSACATTVQNQQLQPWVTGERAGASFSSLWRTVG